MLQATEYFSFFFALFNYHRLTKPRYSVAQDHLDLQTGKYVVFVFNRNKDD